ncbi:hypothetical protein CEXT_26991 [Caerostris extrusa]|uniref:Maturase n=1 Tax=Caerostris extrusa TaxID=172846 RepID=A0AAV4XFJ5_CAEEX|nr:hypothetical protein CEXT_26991 [Caerostris extrusa]
MKIDGERGMTLPKFKSAVDIKNSASLIRWEEHFASLFDGDFISSLTCISLIRYQSIIHFLEILKITPKDRKIDGERGMTLRSSNQLSISQILPPGRWEEAVIEVSFRSTTLRKVITRRV